MSRRSAPWVVVATLIAGCGTSTGSTGVPAAPSTSIAVAAPPTTSAEAMTRTSRAMASTTRPSSPDPGEIAWTSAEAERDVANYLAALSAGEYDVAAWSMANNGVALEDQRRDEEPADVLRRLCAARACLGPYEIRADGPGIIDPRSSQASSTVTVTHRDSGESSSIHVGTFEGQRIVSGFPPLVPSGVTPPTLVEELFDGAVPPRVVIERFDAFEVWSGGATQWTTNWYASDTEWVEGDLAFTDGMVVGLSDPTRSWVGVCGPPLVDDGRILGRACEVDPGGDWGLMAVETGETVAAPVPGEQLFDGEYRWFDVRGGVTLVCIGDAEGNLTSIETTGGVDLLGDDRAGYSALSTDGRFLAYTDHADPATSSHFWSPVVVARSTEDGSQVGRWVLDSAVIGLQMSDRWLVAWLAEEQAPADTPKLAAVAAIDLDTGRVNLVPTRTRVFLAGATADG